MSQNNNIEDVFRSAFESYEEPVNPKIWDAVSSQISGPVSGPQASGVSGSVKGGSIIAGKAGVWIAGAALVAASVAGYYLFTPESTKKESLTEQPVELPSVNSEQVYENADLNASDAAVPEISQNTTESSVESQPEAVDQKAVSNTTSPLPAAQVQLKSDTQEAVSEPAQTAPERTVTAAPAKAVKEPSKLPNSIPPSTFDRYTPIITASPSSGYAPLNVKLSFYGDAKDATWNTGDGTEAITSSVTDHTYNQPGTYTVELVTTDPDGVRHTAKAQIEVKAPSVVNTIPNVFTPNADGMNDRFEVTGEKIQKLEAAIFDKSGRQVYRWTGTDGGWDGRLLSGETAPEGTYFYVIFARGADERSYQFKGTVTLIR